MRECGAATEQGRSVVFVLGSPYSGSTMLGNVLNSFEDVALIGEAERHQAFGRFPDSPEHYLTHCSICATRQPYACPVWTAEAVDPAAAGGGEALIRSYRRLLAAAGERVVVDSSKNVDWMAALLEAGLLGDVRAIVVARSPFAFVVSNRARVPGKGVVWHAVGWRDIYQHTLRTLAVRGIPFLVVRHESLVEQPLDWGRRLGRFLGLKGAEGFDPGRMHARPAHPLGGNLREMTRMAGFDKQGLLRSGVPEAEDIRRLGETAPDYLSAEPVLVGRAGTWRELMIAEMAAIIQTPGVMEVFNALGYSLTQFFTKAPPLAGQAP